MRGFHHLARLPLPRDHVVAVFRDAALRPRWQPDLRSLRHLDGEPGGVGARSELICQVGPRTIVMLETITVAEAPAAFAARYAAEGIGITVTNRFAVAGDATDWELTSSFDLPPWLAMLAPLVLPMLRDQAAATARGFGNFIVALAADRT